MRFYSVTNETLDGADLSADYQGGRAVGVVRAGERHLFFRAGLRRYAIPYGDIRRCYRRVQLVPARMCCGRGDLAVENLVVEGESGQLAQIQLPGERAGKALLELLREKLPDAQFGAPPKEE